MVKKKISKRKNKKRKHEKKIKTRNNNQVI